VIKSWPSRYGCLANDHAIQVLGGSGYTREYLAEQLYRDQRLNPIHEGAEAIHALDLLGRKAVMAQGAAYKVFREAVEATLARARTSTVTQALAAPFAAPLARLDAVTAQLAALMTSDPDRALANASVYLDAFGRIVAAWIWLKQALAAERGLASRPADADFYRGKLQAARYCITWELPATLPQFDLLAEVNPVPLDMRDEWF
jgi:butyryl-CoA dehydrogenase